MRKVLKREIPSTSEKSIMAVLFPGAAVIVPSSFPLTRAASKWFNTQLYIDARYSLHNEFASAFSYGNGQRVNLLFMLLVLLFTAIEFLRNSKITIVKKYLAICSFSILALFLFLKFDTYVNELSKNDSLTTDTRTFLFVELFSDLSSKELLIGRGSLGTYFSEYFYSLKQKDLEGGDHYMRSVNEVGYLQMILKGGFIMVILYLLILIPAAFLGIFRSKNIISRMCGYLILAYLLIWTISYYPVYSVEYIFLWMAVGSTVSEKARNMKIVTTPHPL